MTEPLWTANRVHRLRELIEACYSGSACAETLARECGLPVSRDAVTSKARALGLRFMAQPKGLEREAEPAAEPGRGQGWRATTSLFRLHPIPLPIADLRTIPGKAPVAFEDAQPDACSWPLSDWMEEGTARTLFCGGARAPHCSYCADHAAIAFEARRERAA